MLFLNSYRNLISFDSANKRTFKSCVIPYNIIFIFHECAFFKSIKNIQKPKFIVFRPDKLCFETILTFRFAGRIVSLKSAVRYVLWRPFRPTGPVDVFVRNRTIVSHFAMVSSHHLETSGNRVQVQNRVISVPVAIFVDPHATRHS